MHLPDSFISQPRGSNLSAKFRNFYVTEKQVYMRPAYATLTQLLNDTCTARESCKCCSRAVLASLSGTVWALADVYVCVRQKVFGKEG